ncbi:hypothetical protein ACFQZ4_43020 [Catellatospora coxensis]
MTFSERSIQSPESRPAWARLRCRPTGTRRDPRRAAYPAGSATSFAAEPSSRPNTRFGSTHRDTSARFHGVVD